MVIDTIGAGCDFARRTVRKRLLDALETATEPRPLVGVAAGSRHGPSRAIGRERGRLLYQLVNELAKEVVPFDEIQARLAIAAFGRFGKGMGHRAQLNFGGLCRIRAGGISREPVLATGNDFAATDVARYRL